MKGERINKYYSEIHKKFLIAYDYVKEDGRSFACSANTTEEARKKRQEWEEKLLVINSNLRFVF